VCLLGPSGSGKTTLFKTLLGVLPAQAGAVAVAVDGIDIARLSRRALARTTAYVPQSAAAPFPFTVRESVTMGRAGRVALFSLPAERGRPRRRGGAAGDGHRAPRRAVDFGDQRR
jgi:iron complex transport system ATP-binding protein